MIEFGLTEMSDEQAYYNYLVKVLHPNGLHCPQGHTLAGDQGPLVRRRAPVLDYRCRTCGKFFNAFSGTVWNRTRFRPSVMVQIHKGIAQDIPTSTLADELRISNRAIAVRRHQIRALLASNLPLPPAPT
jgi:transposase-like protein